MASNKKDKVKVINETLNDDKIRRFLKLEPSQGEDKAFHILLRAYRGLNQDDFGRFIEFFKAEKLDINAKSRDGKTILQAIKGYNKSADYVEVLISAGAQ